MHVPMASAPQAAPHPNPAPTPPRRKLKRALKIAALLTLVIALAHRPILQSLIRFSARKAAASQGINLQLNVAGNLFGNLSLDSISATGTSTSPLRSLTAKSVSARYNLRKALSLGPAQAVDELILDDVTLDLDLRSPSPAKPSPSSSSPAALPAIRIPSLICRNVSGTIHLPQGDVVLRNFNLNLTPGTNGQLSLDSLDLPFPAIPNLSALSANVSASSNSLALDNLRGLPGINQASLNLDASALASRSLGFSSQLALPHDASASLSGKLNGLGSQLSLDANLSATRLSNLALAPWLPPTQGLAWQADALTVSLSGPPTSPQALNSSLTLSGGSLHHDKFTVARLAASANLAAGLWDLKLTDLGTGPNNITGTATGQLPPAWPDAAKSPLTANVNIDSPDLAAWFPTTPPLTGSLSGTATASLANGQIRSIESSLSGRQLSAAGIPIQTLDLLATTDGTTLSIKTCRAQLDARNAIALDGTMALSGNRAISANWNASLPNLERLSAFSGIPDLPGPEGGSLIARGSLSSNLDDLSRRDFSSSSAQAFLNASAIRWKSATLQSIEANVSVADNAADLSLGRIILNDRNRLSLTGHSTLVAPFTFDAMLDGDLTKLPDLNAWLAAFKAPPIQNGRATIQWQGRGTVSPPETSGGGRLTLRDFSMDALCDNGSLDLKAVHEGKTASFPILSASLGPFRLSAPATFNGTSLDIPALSASYGSLAPLTGNLSIPLDFAAPPGPTGPVPANRPLAINLALTNLDLAKASAAAKLPPSLSGRLSASLKASGSLTNPVATLSLNSPDISHAAAAIHLKPAAATTSLTLENGRASLRADVRQSPLQPLALDGSIPFDLLAILRNPKALQQLPLSFRASLPQSSLASLAPLVPALRRIDGTASLRADVGGSVANPLITGVFNADAPAITFAKADVPGARDAKIRLRFAGTRVFIEDASAMLAGGTLAAKGSLDWSDLANPAIDATLTAREALVLRDDSISFRADADIRAKGRYNRADVTGKVELRRGRVFKEIEFLPLSLPDQLPPAPPAVTIGSNAPPSLPPPFDQWSLNVQILTRDPVRLLGNALNGGAVSKLRLSGSGARPVLEGKVSLVDARVRLPFSRLNVSRGDLIFTADKPFNPELDVVGDSFVNGYEVQLQAYGEALHPKIRFSSSPPLSEGEIATLLATGSTSENMRGAEGEAANRAAFLVISQMYRKLFKKGLATRESDKAPRLSFSFSPLNNTAGGRSISAVYELNRRLEAVGSVNQNGSFRGLLYYLIRFR